MSHGLFKSENVLNSNAVCTQHHLKVIFHQNYEENLLIFWCPCCCISFLEKLAEAPTKIVKPPVPANANKWDGEDEDDVKVRKP